MVNTTKTERNSELVSRYVRGWSMRMLAQAYGLEMSSVHELIVGSGVPRRPPGARKGDRRTHMRPQGWQPPSPPRLPWRAEIAERLRALRTGEV